MSFQSSYNNGILQQLILSPAECSFLTCSLNGISELTANYSKKTINDHIYLLWRYSISKINLSCQIWLPFSCFQSERVGKVQKFDILDKLTNNNKPDILFHRKQSEPAHPFPRRVHIRSEKTISC